MTKTTQFAKMTISVPSEVYARATRREGTRYQSFSVLCWCGRKGARPANTSAGVIDRINAVVDAVKDDTIEFTAAAARRLLAKDGGTKW
jgi:hypothetical protein